MIVLTTLLWVLAILVTLGALVLALVAVRRSRPLWALPALVPVSVGLILLAARIAIPAQTPVLPLLLGLALFGLGVVAGSPLTLTVLEQVADDGDENGAHGGILVPAGDADSDSDTGDGGGEPTGGSREVMRGGGMIGVLERIAVVGAVAAGRPEALAIVVAIKGLGRFSELETARARERFIIGTLVSLIWSSTVGALIWFGLR